MKRRLTVAAKLEKFFNNFRERSSNPENHEKSGSKFEVFIHPEQK
jgi:hypothetical protein